MYQQSDQQSDQLTTMAVLRLTSVSFFFWQRFSPTGTRTRTRTRQGRRPWWQRWCTKGKGKSTSKGGRRRPRAWQRWTKSRPGPGRQLKGCCWQGCRPGSQDPASAKGVQRACYGRLAHDPAAASWEDANLAAVRHADKGGGRLDSHVRGAAQEGAARQDEDQVQRGRSVRLH